MSFGGNGEFGVGRRDIEYVDRAVINIVLPTNVGLQRRLEERVTTVFICRHNLRSGSPEKENR